MDKGRPKEIVVDTSSLAKLLVGEEGYEEVAKALSNRSVIVVDFQISELSNVLWKRRMAPDEAKKRMALVLLLIDEIVNPLSMWQEAYSIAVRNSLPFYDSAVIALAKIRKTLLLTSDKEQANVAKKEGVNVLVVA